MTHTTYGIAYVDVPAALVAPHGSPIQALVNPVNTAPDWQVRAVRAYQNAQHLALAAMPELVATRLSALIGRSINPADVYMDLDAELAIVVVDGVVFRGHDQQIMILRSCVECGITRFESPPLASLTDLGYALSGWQPRCHTCQPEDPVDIE